MIKFNRFVSDSPETPFAPKWDFRVGTFSCDDIDTNSLCNFLLKKEGEVKNLPSSIDAKGWWTDGGTGLGLESTTSKFQNYNIFDWDHPEIIKLKSNIIRNFQIYNKECEVDTLPVELWAQGWFNIMSKGQQVNPHLHDITSKSYLSGNFSVKVKNTSTCYMSPINQIYEPEIIDIENECGNMSLFPSSIIHYTSTHQDDDPRITIAFDLSYYQKYLNFVRIDK